MAFNFKWTVMFRIDRQTINLMIVIVLLTDMPHEIHLSVLISCTISHISRLFAWSYTGWKLTSKCACTQKLPCVKSYEHTTIDDIHASNKSTTHALMYNARNPPKVEGKKRRWCTQVLYHVLYQANISGSKYKKKAAI